MEQEAFRRMASRARHVVDIREWKEFVMLQFFLTMENDADEQDRRKDEVTSEQNPTRPARGQTHSDART